jgi:transposase
MPKRRILREMTSAEAQELERLSRSRSAEYRVVERAQAIEAAYQGESGNAIAKRLGREADTVYRWFDAFEEEGIAGLYDQPRPGRPAYYNEEQRGQLVVTAKTHPKQLSLPFGSWTLDRLVEYSRKHLQIAISRAQLARLLEAEGLKWYQEKIYFTARPDPQFAEKRGR